MTWRAMYVRPCPAITLGPRTSSRPCAPSASTHRYGLPDITCHVIGCHITHETRVQTALDDVSRGQGETLVPPYTRGSVSLSLALFMSLCLSVYLCLSLSLSVCLCLFFSFSALNDVASRIWRALPRPSPGPRTEPPCRGWAGRWCRARSTRPGVAAPVDIESKIDAKMKAVYHILVSTALFQGL